MLLRKEVIEMARCIIIKTDGEIELAESSGLEDLNRMVGGGIEGIPCRARPDAYTYINGEGKWEGLPVNEVAFEFLRRTGTELFEGDFIAGNMIVVGMGDDGEDHDAPHDLAIQLMFISEQRKAMADDTGE